MKRLILLVILISSSLFLFAQDAMTIDSSGNVGIGQESTGEKLEVDGRIKDETGFVTPVGTVVAYIGNTAPDGWLICDGLTDLTTDIKYADLISLLVASGWTVTTKTPDLRGMFLRGLDPTGIIDPEGTLRRLGDSQPEDLKSHSHSLTFYHANQKSSGNHSESDAKRNYGHGSYNKPTTAYGGSETRPINTAVNYIIKY